MLPGIKQFDLAGKSAIVTGGSKGLGEAIAAGLASAGADVLLTSRNAEEAQAAASQIEADFGHRAIGMKADVTEVDEIDSMVERALSAFGKIDILVNNAGINNRGLLGEQSYEQFKEVQKINVDGVWLCIRAVLGHMKKAKYGRIVQVASTLSVVGMARRTAYATSKGGVAQLTRTLALEVASFGITCNAICPGPFLTPLNEPTKNDPDIKQNLEVQVALQRWGRMEEIQGAAIFLASDASSYVTGSLLMVDGGWTAR